MPTLFIDSSDIMAKHEKELFTILLQQAKDLANAEILTIVFVSSQGSILPVVQKSSAFSRSAKLFKVTDIDED